MFICTRQQKRFIPSHLPKRYERVFYHCRLRSAVLFSLALAQKEMLKCPFRNSDLFTHHTLFISDNANTHNIQFQIELIPRCYSNDHSDLCIRIGQHHFNYKSHTMFNASHLRIDYFVIPHIIKNALFVWLSNRRCVRLGHGPMNFIHHSFAVQMELNYGTKKC